MAAVLSLPARVRQLERHEGQCVAITAALAFAACADAAHVPQDGDVIEVPLDGGNIDVAATAAGAGGGDRPELAGVTGG